ncbi:TolC family protein [Cryomorphaceae bacterium 1068]|nr:TolC family protein [Cryomorphaceae bacterium 1068]
MGRVVFFFLLFCGLMARSQNPVPDSLMVQMDDYEYVQPPDTMLAMLTDSILDYEEFIYWVRINHPVAEIADLEVELARGELRMSRGGFDPLLYGNYRTKDFKDTEYYDALQAGIEIPTWMGISLQAGYEDNQGAFLNPEATVPQSGLINAGISAQLGAGLLMDDRRAALRQAQIGLEAGENQRQIISNQLYFEATSAYFNWSFASRSLTVAEEALELANVRYLGVKESYFLGDVPAIDTVEAYTQVLTRLFNLRESQNYYIESINLASAYIWSDDGNPVSLPPFVRPIWAGDLSSDGIFVPISIDITHPELLKLLFKGQTLDIDRRLASQYILPKIELKYNFLTENVLPAPPNEFFQNNAFFQENYNFGAKVSFPIFVREARGKLGMTKVKIDMVEREVENKRAQLDAKLASTLVKLENLREQINIFEQNVELFQVLLNGERELFRIGESSLFLINARETKLIESRVKYYELMAKEKILLSEVRTIGGLGFP